MEYLRLGQASKTFGLLGQIRFFSLTDFAKQRFHVGNTYLLFNEKSNERVPVTLSFFRDASDSYFLGFKEITTIDQASHYLGWFIEMDKALAPLPKGYYRLQDIKGCAVFDENKKKLGTVSDILAYAPTKTLVVSREGEKPFYVPFLMKEFILSIDVEKKEIVIKVMPGLL
jgi:16S rRNA processing protein RimM